MRDALSAFALWESSAGEPRPPIHLRDPAIGQFDKFNNPAYDLPLASGIAGGLAAEGG